MLNFVFYRKHLLYERLAVAAADPKARHVEEIDISKEVLGRSDISCITVSIQDVFSLQVYKIIIINRTNISSISIQIKLNNLRAFF